MLGKPWGDFGSKPPIFVSVKSLIEFALTKTSFLLYFFFVDITFILGMGRISASASADVPHFFDIRIRVLSADVYI